MTSTSGRWLVWVHRVALKDMAAWNAASGRIWCLKGPDGKHYRARGWACPGGAFRPLAVTAYGDHVEDTGARAVVEVIDPCDTMRLEDAVMVTEAA